MIFNIVIYVVVRAVLDVVCRPKEARHGLGWLAGNINLVFYANNVRIFGREHEWVHDTLTVMVEIFLRMGLDTNL